MSLEVIYSNVLWEIDLYKLLRRSLAHGSPNLLFCFTKGWQAFLWIYLACEKPALRHLAASVQYICLIGD